MSHEQAKAASEAPGEGVMDGDAPRERVGGGSSGVARASVLSRPTDFVQRPGFRNPANARTKAQKGGKKGGRSR